MGMASGVSQASYGADGPLARLFYQLLYLERVLCVGLVFLNLAALARERRPSLVALVALWSASSGALYMGNTVLGVRRVAFLVASFLCMMPLATTLVCAMGERLRMSQLQTAYRFLSAWCVVCCTCYDLIYFLCEVVYILNTETEILLYMLLDLCIIAVPSLGISCAGSELESGLLPAQEAELSLYPGPHNYGFYPNPDFYNDNL
jgi:bacteriorhodopsin